MCMHALLFDSSQQASRPADGSHPFPLHGPRHLFSPCHSKPPPRARVCMSTPRTSLIADIEVLPSTPGYAENEFVNMDAAIETIAASGLEYSVHEWGTTINGPADAVWATARAAYDACIASGASKDVMVLKMYQGSRTAEQLTASGEAGALAAGPSRDPNFESPVLIFPGSHALPPLFQVSGGFLPLKAVIKPPDEDALWQWEEMRGNMQADCSWASMWPAASSLAALLMKQPDLVSGKMVAELGSGLGVVGLTAAKVLELHTN
ncbi:MAG: hypothetical protein SGPRY_000016 [Prymnesium sp.]